jgi:CarD family transcriptional regulator
MSSSRKAAKNAKSKATTNKVMARSSAKEKTKTGKPAKTSVKEDAKKALKLKAGTATSSKGGAKTVAKVSVKAARPVAAVKAKDTKKSANKSAAIAKPAKPAVAPVKAAARLEVKAPAAVTAKALVDNKVLADKKAKIQTNPVVAAAGNGRSPSNTVKTEENKPIVKNPQQTNAAPVKSTPAPVKATAQASAKPAAAVAKPAAKPATPPKAMAPKVAQASKPAAAKPVAAMAAKSTDAKETKSSPAAKPIVKPAATAKPAVAAVAPKPVEKPAAAVAAPAAPPMHMRPAMHQSRSPFGVRAPFPPIVRPVDPRVAAGGKPGASPKTGFKTNEYIVYPAHGVGQIIATEEQEVAGYKLELFVISFFKDKLTLKVPLPKVLQGAIRKLSDGPTVQKSLDTLTGRARVKRTMWSRRAQEYEAKINSGDLVAIAEVVRDLYRSEAQPEQSYSERQLYEAALDRMAREVAVVQKLTETESLKLIEQHLEKGPRRGTRAEAAAEADAEGDADGDVVAGSEIDAAA